MPLGFYFMVTLFSAFSTSSFAYDGPAPTVAPAPPPLVRQIGADKWFHSIGILIESPEVDSIIVERTLDNVGETVWEYKLVRNLDGTFSKIISHRGVIRAELLVSEEDMLLVLE